jgi:hypothetical protein
MYLYLISQSVNNDYDTFDSAVVIAPSKEEARNMHPNWPDSEWPTKKHSWYNCWADRPEQVTVSLIGTALRNAPQSVVCSSFNAG